MRYIIVDLEATCWEGDLHDPKRMEIIEIGAVCMASAKGPVQGEFGELVKPVGDPVLSDFCKSLTTIRQEDVDQAEHFREVFPRFLQWIGDEPFSLGSWGQYDFNQFQQDCHRHNIPFPQSFQKHVNIKKIFSDIRQVKVCGMKRALEFASLPLKGTHHPGLDDARNIANLAQLVLPLWEEKKGGK